VDDQGLHPLGRYHEYLAGFHHFGRVERGLAFEVAQFPEEPPGAMYPDDVPIAGVVASGEIKLLGIASAARLPNYPDTPTISETVPDFTSSDWSILVAPHGTPAAIVQKINDDLRTALGRPALTRKFEELGNYTRPMTPQQLSDFVRSERKLWGPIVKQIGIAVQSKFLAVGAVLPWAEARRGRLPSSGRVHACRESREPRARRSYDHRQTLSYLRAHRT